MICIYFSTWSPPFSTRYWRRYMTGRRGRHKQLPDELRENRRYWKLKEKALAGCVWWTRFGRSYGPVADRLRDDDDDDDDTNMSPIQGRSLDTVAMGCNGKRLPTSDSAVRCQYAVSQGSILILQSTLYYLAIYRVVKCNLVFPLRIKFHVSLLDHWWPHELLKHVSLNISYVQTFLNLTLEKTWLLWRLRQQALPYSCPWTNITISRKRPTNVYIYY